MYEMNWLKSKAYSSYFRGCKSSSPTLLKALKFIAALLIAKVFYSQLIDKAFVLQFLDDSIDLSFQSRVTIR